MNQYQIEKTVGIDIPLGQYINTAKTQKCKQVVDLLSIAVALPDSACMALLEEAVKACKSEMNSKGDNE